MTPVDPAPGSCHVFTVQYLGVTEYTDPLDFDGKGACAVGVIGHS